MEPEGSLPCSQNVSTSAWPETDNPVHATPSCFSRTQRNISLVYLDLLSGLFVCGSRTKILYAFSPCVVRTMPISPFFTLSF
jgi:hypothetical protein